MTTIRNEKKDFSTLEKELKAALEGNVFFDSITRHVYSVDASIFEIEPIGVVIPKTKQDLFALVEIARHFKVPLIPRGAATGITGGCLGEGLIIDLSTYWNHILQIDLSQKFAICEPGVTQDQLNQSLAPHGYRLGPDTSTGNRATLGGMLANNAAGARSLRYGKMVDHVQAVDILLSTGELLHFSSTTEKEWQQLCQKEDRKALLYRTLWEIKQSDEDEIRKHFPPLPRRVSGYNLDELLKPSPFNVSKLIAGSEGTLGIVTQMKMAIVEKPKATGLLLFFFDDLLAAMYAVPPLLEFHPLSLELIDDKIIEPGRKSPLLRNRLDWLKGHPKAVLMLEMEGETLADVREKMESILSSAKKNPMSESPLLLLDATQIADMWELRKAGLGILLSKRSYNRSLAFIEDLSIPPSHLPAFMQTFCTYLAKQGKEAGIYGHAGAGCMHIRPYFDLRDPRELSLMQQMMEDVSTLVLKEQGALSGEHGDGWIRSWLNPKMFGERLMHAFRQIKHVFDPVHLMNPGKIIPTKVPWENLRTTPNETLQSPPLFLDFKPEGGFELAVDLCNGNGHCRKSEGVMCPSFQVTQKEFHSTRARAQALRSIVHKKLPLEAFTSEGLHAVLDLCLSCKGCKTECPSQVDMAKMKSEFLYHYQERKGYSLRSRLFGHIGQIQSWMSLFPSLFNPLNHSSLLKQGLQKIGISPKRSLPLLAKQRFSSWFARYSQPSGLRKQLILFNDTFTEFNHPSIGKAAVQLLNALGYHVIVPPWSCCGRPALSKGLLPYARHQAHGLLQQLEKYERENTPVIGLEPSCLLTIKDDYTSLVLPEERGRVERWLGRCWTLDEFLAQEVEQGNLQTLPFQQNKRTIKVHGHCYQKALVGMKPTLTVLRAIPGFQVEEIPSGCCGMAGSFGYEIEHEAISMQMGELHLLPAIRKSLEDDWIIASGTSCRQQILDGTQRNALHLAEALNTALQNFS